MNQRRLEMVEQHANSICLSPQRVCFKATRPQKTEVCWNIEIRYYRLEVSLRVHGFHKNNNKARLTLSLAEGASVSLGACIETSKLTIRTAIFSHRAFVNGVKKTIVEKIIGAHTCDRVIVVAVMLPIVCKEYRRVERFILADLDIVFSRVDPGRAKVSCPTDLEALVSESGKREMDALVSTNIKLSTADADTRLVSNLARSSPLPAAHTSVLMCVGVHKPPGADDIL